MAALVIGINYTGGSNPLNGCVNDAVNMVAMLQRRGYNCTVMTDTVIQTAPLPTRSGILKALLDLILSGENRLFFHYSGHGSQVRDVNYDEADGMDETLVPLDYETNGMITDDELRGILCCLRANQKLVMVLDCCHSGTGIDAPYTLYKSYVGSNYTMQRDPSRAETSGQVIMLSGCMDNQTSADAYINGNYQGALSASFLKFINEAHTWSNLIQKIRSELKAGGYEQFPNLSSGKPLDVNKFEAIGLF